MAEKQGFTRLAAASDYQSVPSSTLVVRTDRIKKNPKQIKAMIRAMLKTLRYYREHRSEMIQAIVKMFGGERDTATKAYEELYRIMSPTGKLPTEGIQFMIDRARKRNKVKREISASEAIDLTLWREVTSKSR